MNLYDKLFSQINQSQKILLISHFNPDGDAIGSTTAFGLFLISQKKEIAIFCASSVPVNLKHLLLTNSFSAEKLKITDYDLIIALDCSSFDRTALQAEINTVRGRIPFINIDHHAMNSHFADLNIVEPTASSTSEIIYKIFQHKNISLTPAISSALLTGIIDDTTFFTNKLTTKRSIAIAAKLLEKGARQKQLLNNYWKRYTPDSLKKWGHVLNNLQFNPNHKSVTAVIPRFPDLDPGIFEEFSNFLTTIHEVDLIFVLYEQANHVRCSMRSRNSKFNVAEIAIRFGGGGHPRAAGFSIPGKLEQTEEGWRVV